MTIRRLDLIYAVQGVAFGTIMPFPVALLVERGMDAAEIGLILGLSGLVALLAYPVWGAIADGWLGRPRTIALTAVTAAVGGLLVLASGSDPVTLALVISVVMVGAVPWGPLIDALVLDELGDDSTSYGRIRMWGSAGWAVSAVVAGAVWMLVGPALVFTAFVASSLLLAAIVLWSPRPGAAEPPVERAPRTVSGARSAVRSWLPLFLTPVLLGFMLGLLITSVGEHASWQFIGLRILDQGGGVFLIGLAAALPALVEIPVFVSSRRLVAAWGLRSLFVMGAVIAAILMALVALAPEPWMVTALRTVDGTSYAMRYMAMVMIIGVLLPRHLYALGQSVAWLAYAGVAPIIADIAGGLIYEVFGATALFAVATVTLLLGGAVVWLALSGPSFARRMARTDEQAITLPVPPPPAA